MKKYVYVDTAALIALSNKTDGFHQLASQVNQQLIAEQYTFLTTNAVILELANAFSQRRVRSTHHFGRASMRNGEWCVGRTLRIVREYNGLRG